MTRYLLVPGRGVPRPEHWMRRWADRHPSYRWAPRPTGPPFDLEARVAALHAAITAQADPAVLIAHSAGCITVTVWAGRHAGPVRAALLVTPPYIDPQWTVEPAHGPVGGWTVPRAALAFRSILVASRTDPYTTVAQFQRYADDWGAEFVDAGDTGHLDTASGFGPWPQGERLLARL